jgi:hypothetical protein
VRIMTVPSIVRAVLRPVIEPIVRDVLADVGREQAERISLELADMIAGPPGGNMYLRGTRFKDAG